MRTRYALVGVGGRGIGVFARSLVTDGSDVADLVALCDVNPQRMEVDLVDRYHGPDIDGVVRRLEWGGGPAIRISPLFGRPYVVEVERREGGHRGADERIREHLFRPDTADPLGQRADSRAGAMSVLLGVAGNLSIESDEPGRRTRCSARGEATMSSADHTPGRERRADEAPSRYRYSMDYDDPLLAYLYDRTETYTDDLELLRELIGGARGLNVLECFSGTGRLLIPLVQDGHRVTGIEIAAAMSARAAARAAELPPDVGARVTLRVGDALDGDWGVGYDLVILAANALYELPSAGAQARCVALAAEAVAPGGHVFIDNDDYKGDWGRALSRRPRVVFEGTDPQGRHGRLTLHPERYDERRQVLHLRRVWTVREPDGTVHRVEYRARKRPVAYAEIAGWLERYGLRVVRVYGSRRGTPYAPHSERAIFWAERPA